MKFKKLYPGLVLALVIIYLSCRKYDSRPEAQVFSDNNSKFFNAHRSSDKLEETIVNYLVQQDAKVPFVERSINQVGYPMWNKKMVISKTKVNSKGATEATTIAYIPFVRDAENFVNASIAVRFSPGDTSFWFLCDWQYSRRQFQGSGTMTDSSAEKMALLFMALDQNTFGRNRFDITDMRLFHGSSNYADTVNKTRWVKIEPLTNGARNTTMASICYTTTVYTIGMNHHCVGCWPNPCDMCTAVCVDWYTTTTTEVHCFDEEINPPPPTGGGGSGGGGSGSGNTNPPPCNGIPVAKGADVTDPCQPGWVPPPPPPPCDQFMTTLKNDQNFRNKFIELNDPLATNNSVEKGYEVNDRANNSYTPKSGVPGNGFIQWSISGLIDGLLHSHFQGYNNIFSADDILFMARLYKANLVRDPANFFFGMTSATGEPYLVKVTNLTKFGLFCDKIIAMENQNNGFTTHYNPKLNSGDNTKNVKEFLKMLQDLGGLGALTLFAAAPNNTSTYDFDHWLKLGWDGFDITTTDCN